MAVRSVVIAAGLVGCAAPALAEQNSYGGYDIAGDPQYEETFYGNTRGWAVVEARDEYSRVIYCAAERPDGDTIWRIGTDGGQWQVAVVADAPPDWQGNLVIDGQSAFAGGTARSGWTIVWLGLQDLASVADGNLMVVEVGRASIAHPLTGTAAVITLIEECVQASGGTAYQRDNGVDLAAAPVPPRGGSPTQVIPPASEEVDFVDATNGSIPGNATPLGFDSSGDTLYSCVVAYNGGLHPGKIRPGFAGCHFGFGGIEYENATYRVMVGTGGWRMASNGTIPDDVVAVGYEANGSYLGVCRAQFNGLQVGKIGPSTGSCAIAYGGTEHTIYQYEVMTKQ